MGSKPNSPDAEAKSWQIHRRSAARWLTRIVALMAIVASVTIALPGAVAGAEQASQAAQVVEGNDADEGEYPHMVSLQSVQNRIQGQNGVWGDWGVQPAGLTARELHRCGASLIAPDKVLTAAHCIDYVLPSGERNQNQVRALIGRTDLADTSTGVLYDVVRYDIHEDFSWRDFLQGPDMAILTLDRPVPNAQVVPLLGLAAADLPTGDATVTGWGVVDPAEGADPAVLDALQEAVLLQPGLRSECDNDLYLCADGVPQVCSGDSGGPVHVAGEQVAVTAGSTEGCRTFGIYTSVFESRAFLRCVGEVEVGTFDPADVVGSNYCSTAADRGAYQPFFACSAGGGVVTWTDAEQSRYWVYRSTDGGLTYSWIGRTLGDTSFVHPETPGALYQVHYSGIPRERCSTIPRPDAEAESITIQAEDYVRGTGDFSVSQNPSNDGRYVGLFDEGESISYRVVFPTAGRYGVRLSSGSVGAQGGTVTVRIRGVRVGEETRLPGTGSWYTFEPTEFASPSVELEAGMHIVTLTWTGFGRSTLDSFEVFPIDPGNPEPPRPTGDPSVGDFIHAENYVKAKDTEPGNQGSAGQFTGDADVSGSNGEFHVDRIRPGEELSYRVQFPTAGLYEVNLSTASFNSAGTGTVTVRIAGARVGTYKTSLPRTGGWSRYETTEFRAVNVPAGTHVVTLQWEGPGASRFDGLTVLPSGD